jgi:hypothetical protein
MISECNVRACRIGYSDSDLLQFGTGVNRTICRMCTKNNMNWRNISEYFIVWFLRCHKRANSNERSEGLQTDIGQLDVQCSSLGARTAI